VEDSGRRTVFVIGHISSSARRFLKQRRDESTRARFSEALEIITTSPLHYQQRIKPIKGRYKNEFRYRFGGIRIHYRVDYQTGVIDLLNIDDRGDITY